MPNPILLLFIALVLIALPYLVQWVRILRANPPGIPSWTEALIGFVTNFFDTLGIGSFAPTTALFRAFRLVPDETIPGTLNVGHTLPTIVQAFIYILIIKVEFATLALLIAASILGSWLGAGVVCKWSRRNIQLGMGIALLAAAGLFVIKNLDEMRGVPVFPGGEALGLHGGLLYAALAGNFVLGALMTLGIGLYAPCLIMISLLGMDPKAAFPIMMGSCAFLMPVASLRFLKAGSVSQRPALGLALAGIPAVLIAAKVVKSMNLTAVRWLVVIVVLYTAVTMIRAGMRAVAAPTPEPAA
ncbi:MAG: sulfite exporter TauE/SafE family protein [Gemmatimonadota bacterium]